MSAAETFALAQLGARRGEGENEVVLGLALCPARTGLVAATSQGDLCHLDAQTLGLRQRIRAHGSRIVACHFLGEQRREASLLCSFGAEGRVLGWDLRCRGAAGAALRIETGAPLASGHAEPFGSSILVTGAECAQGAGVIAFWYGTGGGRGPVL